MIRLQLCDCRRLALLSMLFAPVIHAQGVRLAAASDSISEQFSSVHSIRELRDGRVIVGDKREGRLVVADFRRNTVRDIGRTGYGPKEYPAIGSLVAIANDSTLMVDNGARRWLVLHGDSIIGLVSKEDRLYELAGGGLRSADSLGNLLAAAGQRTASIRNSQERLDSVALVVIARRHMRADTVGAIASSSTRVAASGAAPNGGPARVILQFPALNTAEDVVMMRDGWLAVARLAPYRVDWRTPSGGWRRGAPLPFEKVPVTRRERDEVRRLSEQAGGRAGVPTEMAEWPEVIPPFLMTPLLETPGGTVLVRRVPSVSAPETRYDHVGRDGRLIAQIVLSPNERLVGFGRAAMYSVSVDDDGLERLRKHVWR